MSDYTTQDAIGKAMDGDLAGFKTAVNSVLTAKINDAIEVKKMQVATNFMSSETEEIVGETDGD
jgi:hypothetical protein